MIREAAGKGVGICSVEGKGKGDIVCAEKLRKRAKKVSRVNETYRHSASRRRFRCLSDRKSVGSGGLNNVRNFGALDNIENTKALQNFKNSISASASASASRRGLAVNVIPCTAQASGDHVAVNPVSATVVLPPLVSRLRGRQ